ncbi:MAG: hypothetical protein ACYS8W_10045 [Planctomycetota bacterium]
MRKHPFHFFLVTCLTILLCFYFQGCGGGNGGSRDGVASTGTGTIPNGTGTGTGSGTTPAGVVKAFDIQVVFTPSEATTADMEAFGSKIDGESDWYWAYTYGQFYIKSATIKKGSPEYPCVVVSTMSNMIGGGAYGQSQPGTPGAYMEVGAACPEVTFDHEFGHWQFGLPDHYSRGTSDLCLQNTNTMMQAINPSSNDKVWWCSSARGATGGDDGGPPCWDRVKDHFGASDEKENETWDTANAPATTITVQ